MIKQQYIQKPERVGVIRNISGAVDEYWSTVYQRIGSLDTVNHPNWRRKDDGGGSFGGYWNNYTKYSSNSVSLQNFNSTYVGTLTAPYIWPDWAPIGSAATYGSIAWNAMKPTKPNLDLYNMIFELKDLPGMIVQAERGFANSLSGVGDRFLSQVFGWIPAVNDAIKVITAQQKAQKRVEWLLHNQGKWIPRSWKAAESKAEYVDPGFIDDFSSIEQLFVSSFYRGTPRRKDTYRHTDEIWANAQFQYFLPDAPSPVILKRRLITALNGGRNITLANLYRMVPWTWLIDWAFNASSVLEALDNGITDRLAARRFYLMRKIRYYTKREAQGFYFGPGGSSVDVSCFTEAETVSKSRVVGSPFFPPIGGDLSPMQYGILGALGASRYG